MKISSLHQALQIKLGSYTGEHLATTLRYLDHNGYIVEKPLFDATLDEVAFAIQTLSAEVSAIHRRRNALDSLYTLARHHGFLGANTVGAIAVEVAK